MATAKVHTSQRDELERATSDDLLLHPVPDGRVLSEQSARNIGVTDSAFQKAIGLHSTQCKQV
jgi:hypothetical protein